MLAKDNGCGSARPSVMVRTGGRDIRISSFLKMRRLQGFSSDVLLYHTLPMFSDKSTTYKRMQILRFAQNDTTVECHSERSEESPRLFSATNLILSACA